MVGLHEGISEVLRSTCYTDLTKAGETVWRYHLGEMTGQLVLQCRMLVSIHRPVGLVSLTDLSCPDSYAFFAIGI